MNHSSNTDDRAVEETVLDALAAPDVAAGEDVLRFLVRQLARALNVRYAFLAHTAEPDAACGETLAIWAGSGFAPNFQYPLEGSPCRDVLLRNDHTVILTDAQRRYPQDPLLVEMGIESYWGVPVRGRRGDVCGWLAVADAGPMRESPRTRALLDVFATWASVELERRGTEEQYEMLFREMLNGFAVHEIICDEAGLPVDYRFLAVNPAFERLTGLHADAILGKTVREIIPEVEPEWIRTYGSVALTGQPAHFESYTRTLDRHYEVSAYRSQRHQFACIFTDITERKRAESERQKLEQAHQQALKMESIGRLAGGIAHDLNNLLTPILGYGQLLQGELAADDARREGVDEIVRAAVMAKDLVQRLLAFGRKQLLEFKTIDLNGLLADFERLLRRTVREDIELRIVPSSSSIAVHGDRGQIEQVILNLVVNAQDAMPEGGHLTIETALVHLDEGYLAAHPGVSPGPHAMLTITDTGCGMAESTRARLFEPFFTTKEPGRGTGLGLATVYGIVKQHDGIVSVDSEPGRGTTFKVFLKAVGGTATAEVARPRSEHQGGFETILLVEDSVAVRNLAAGILRRLGYRVLSAGDGETALSMLKVHDGLVHLLLADVVLPGINAKELFDRALRIQPTLKALYMSGYTTDVIAHRGVLDKGVHFVQKPFTLQSLAQKVREALE